MSQVAIVNHEINQHTRIDRNIGDVEIFKIYGKDQLMVKNVLIYLFHNYQFNIDGYNKIDPYDFARVMNLSKQSVRKPHPSPYQKEKLGEELFKEREEEGQDMFKTVFENALYRLMMNNTDFVIRTKNEHGVTIQMNKPLTFVEEVYTVTEKGKGSPKKYYHVKIHDIAKANMSGYFFRAKTDEYAKLKSSDSLTNLYLYLLKLQATLVYKHGPERVGTPAFDKLASVCEAEGEPRAKKYIIDRCFTDLIKRCPSMGVELRWTGSGRWLYTPEIHFDFDKAILETSKEQWKRFERYFNELLMEAYQKIGTGVPFSKWVINPELDWKIKKEIYVKAYNITFGEKNKINIYNERVTHFVNTGQHKFMPSAK